MVDNTGIMFNIKFSENRFTDEVESPTGKFLLICH